MSIARLGRLLLGTKLSKILSVLSCAIILAAVTGVFSPLNTRAEEAAKPGGAALESSFKYFAFLTSDKYSDGERKLLFITLGVAFAGLAYAYMLMRQVNAADQGTPRMQAVAAAVREGANAYLKKQLSIVAVLIAILVVVLYVAKAMSSPLGFSDPFALGRAGAFLMGAIFSGLVGFVGMRLATTGNLRVAAAARDGFG